MKVYQTFITRPLSDFKRLEFLTSYIDLTDGFVAGGCFKNIFLGKKFKDVDIFFDSYDKHIAAVTSFLGSKDYELEYENRNACGFINIKDGTKIDLCKTGMGDPTETLEVFDFTVTKFAIFKYAYQYYVVYHKDFFKDLYSKSLVLESLFGNHRPGLIERVDRYARYGFNPNRDLFRMYEEIKRIYTPEQIEKAKQLYKHGNEVV